MGKSARGTAYRFRFFDTQGLRVPVLCLFFLIGIVLGHLCAHLCSDTAALSAHLQSASAADPAEAAVLQIVLLYFRDPLMILLLSCCSFGTMAIPLLLIWEGFSLSFAAASLALSLGRSGVVLALAAFGIRGVIVIICMLLLAQWALVRLAGGSEEGTAPFTRTVMVCLALLVVGTILELTVVPKLFSMALSAIGATV